MARLVLLSFSNNADAERFTRLVANEDPLVPTVVHSGDDANAIIETYPIVEWVCALPTKACECAQTAAKTGRRRRNKGGTSSDGFRKGQRFGWWVHANCGRVTKMVRDRFITYKLVDAYDLLPEILGDPERVPNDGRQYMHELDNSRTRR